MLSRVADALYWLTRYIERAENLARFVDVTYNLQIECGADAGEVWPSLVQVTGDQDWFADRYGLATADSVTHCLTFDENYPHSIRNCVRAARENARSIREAISSEMWEQLNQFHHFLQEAAGSTDWRLAPQDFYQEVKLQSQLFKGLTDSTMRRGDGWNFARLGRLLERADKTSRLLDVKYYILLPRVDHVNSSVDDLQWQAVLGAVSAFEPYRQWHHGITPSKVVEFLVLDRLFPRAIRYAVVEAERAVHCITGTPENESSNCAEARLADLRRELSETGVEQLIQRGLHESLDAIQSKLNAIGDGIYETFITTTPTRSSRLLGLRESAPSAG